MTDHTPTPRATVSTLQPYLPGRPATNEDGCLASNESPFGPSPQVEKAVASAARALHRYRTLLRPDSGPRLPVSSTSIPRRSS